MISAKHINKLLKLAESGDISEKQLELLKRAYGEQLILANRILAALKSK